MKYSKGKDAHYKCLRIQNYIKSDKLTTDQKSLLHQLRFRMINIRDNYKNMYQDVNCLWCEEVENSEHLLNCSKLIENCPELYNDNVVKFEDVYSDELVKQTRATILYEKVLKVREELLREREVQSE